jgi:hypothetical protein
MLCRGSHIELLELQGRDPEKWREFKRERVWHDARVP